MICFVFRPGEDNLLLRYMSPVLNTRRLISTWFFPSGEFTENQTNLTNQFSDLLFYHLPLSLQFFMFSVKLFVWTQYLQYSYEACRGRLAAVQVIYRKTKVNYSLGISTESRILFRCLICLYLIYGFMLLILKYH